MKDQLAYLKYVIRHKAFVFQGCLKMGVPSWRAIVHDCSKFPRAEWMPYVRQFFNPDGSKRQVRDATGAYNPNAQSVEFKYAWLSHQRNKHHWQAWISIGDGGSLTAMPMLETYAREMVADWLGAGWAINGKNKDKPFDEIKSWYGKNKDKMILHIETRKLVESLLMQLDKG